MRERESVRRCFVIGPIGSEHSETRRKSDWLLRSIIKPVLEEEPFNLRVMRADQDPRPGMIDSQVINAVSDADLVVADLSEQNANVFYELAIRHMEEKPAIHMIRNDDHIPFDVHPYRTIEYRLDWPDDIEKAKEKLRQQASDALSVEHEVDNPVIKARGQKALRRTAHGEIKAILDLVIDQNIMISRTLTSITERLDQLESLPEIQRYRREFTRTLGEVLLGRTRPTEPSPDNLLQLFVDLNRNLRNVDATPKGASLTQKS